MSRQPPGGTSTICFGTEDSPFRKSAPATPGSPPKSRIASALSSIQPGEALTPAHKQQIYGIVQDAEDVEDLVCKLADVLSTPLPPASAGINGGHGQGLNGARGFKPPALKVESALANFRDALKRRGVDSLARLAKKFKIMDDDNSRTLCYDELKKGMLESGCKLEEAEMQALFRFLDADCTGDINIDEFFIGVRGEMNTRRMALVMGAFDKLDVNGDGALTVNDLAGSYDCSRHPDVVAGIATEVEVLQNFLSGFDGTMGPPTKIITPEKFATYYAGVSCSIDDDDYFELMLRNVWHIPGGEGECEETACRRLLVTHEDGSQSIETLAEDITVTKEDLQEMKRRLAAQGVPVVKISLYGDLTGADAVPTTSSPTKKTAPIIDREEDGVIASAYKQRMAASNVTF